MPESNTAAPLAAAETLFGYKYGATGTAGKDTADLTGRISPESSQALQSYGLVCNTFVEVWMRDFAGFTDFPLSGQDAERWAGMGNSWADYHVAWAKQHAFPVFKITKPEDLPPSGQVLPGDIVIFERTDSTPAKPQYHENVVRPHPNGGYQLVGGRGRKSASGVSYPGSEYKGRPIKGFQTYDQLMQKVSKIGQAGIAYIIRPNYADASPPRRLPVAAPAFTPAVAPPPLVPAIVIVMPQPAASPASTPAASPPPLAPAAPSGRGLGGFLRALWNALTGGETLTSVHALNAQFDSIRQQELQRQFQDTQRLEQEQGWRLQQEMQRLQHATFEQQQQEMQRLQRQMERERQELDRQHVERMARLQQDHQQRVEQQQQLWVQEQQRQRQKEQEHQQWLQDQQRQHQEEQQRQLREQEHRRQQEQQQRDLHEMHHHEPTIHPVNTHGSDSHLHC